jgi:hypothetical protein
VGPFFAAAVGGAPAADPTQAVLLDHHQARLLAEEDLIGGHLVDAGAAEFIQDGQESGGPLPRRVREAAELGDAGRLAFPGRVVGERLGEEHAQVAFY